MMRVARPARTGQVPDVTDDLRLSGGMVSCPLNDSYGGWLT
jgi:hypothetical protein